MTPEQVERVIENNWLKVVEQPDGNVVEHYEGMVVTVSDGLFVYDGKLWVLANERR